MRRGITCSVERSLKPAFKMFESSNPTVDKLLFIMIVVVRSDLISKSLKDIRIDGWLSFSVADLRTPRKGSTLRRFPAGLARKFSAKGSGLEELSFSASASRGFMKLKTCFPIVLGSAATGVLDPTSFVVDKENINRWSSGTSYWRGFLEEKMSALDFTGSSGSGEDSLNSLRNDSSTGLFPRLTLLKFKARVSSSSSTCFPKVFVGADSTTRSASGPGVETDFRGRILETDFKRGSFRFSLSAGSASKQRSMGSSSSSALKRDFFLNGVPEKVFTKLASDTTYELTYYTVLANYNILLIIPQS